MIKSCDFYVGKEFNKLDAFDENIIIQISLKYQEYSEVIKTLFLKLSGIGKCKSVDLI